MRKTIIATVAALALVAAAPASAQPDPGTGNGCGWLFKELAAPGFGQSVADAARGTGLDETVDLLCRNELP